MVRPFQTFDPEAKNERASRHQLSDEVMVPVHAWCIHIRVCVHMHTSQGLFETRNAENKKDTKAVTDRPTVDIISALVQKQLPSFSKMVLAPNSPTRAALLARLEVELRNEVSHEQLLSSLTFHRTVRVVLSCRLALSTNTRRVCCGTRCETSRVGRGIPSAKSSSRICRCGGC